MPERPPAAIVDYGLGNLFSVKHACAWARLPAVVTASPADILRAPVVILPGVGAFGDAMAALERLDLVAVLRDVAAAGTPLIGICLGLQLLLTESHEFGRHRGLGLIDGDVVRLSPDTESPQRLKVPQVGWKAIAEPAAGAWRGTPLAGVGDGEFMYFVHSFYARPVAGDDVLAVTRYGATSICAAVRRGNLCAFQFHPERSGPAGLWIYRNLAALAGTTTSEDHGVADIQPAR